MRGYTDKSDDVFAFAAYVLMAYIKFVQNCRVIKRLYIIWSKMSYYMALSWRIY